MFAEWLKKGAEFRLGTDDTIENHRVVGFLEDEGVFVTKFSWNFGKRLCSGYMVWTAEEFAKCRDKIRQLVEMVA